MSILDTAIPAAGKADGARAHSVMMDRRYDAIRVAWRLSATLPAEREPHILATVLNQLIGHPENRWERTIAET